jgi:hypothetical protein
MTYMDSTVSKLCQAWSAGLTPMHLPLESGTFLGVCKIRDLVLDLHGQVDNTVYIVPSRDCGTPIHISLQKVVKANTVRPHRCIGATRVERERLRAREPLFTHAGSEYQRVCIHRLSPRPVQLQTSLAGNPSNARSNPVKRSLNC